MRRWAPDDTRHSPGGLGDGSAWRHVSPARRFLVTAAWSVDFLGVTYKAFSDASKVGLLVFLELLLETYLLSCGSG